MKTTNRIFQCRSYQTTLFFVLCLMLTACLQNPLREQSRPVPQINTTPKAVPQVTSTSASQSDTKEKESRTISQTVEIKRGTGEYLGAEPQQTRRSVDSDERGVTLNFKDMDLQEFIKAVLGEVLKQNYVIDPAVTGRVTIQTVKPLPEEQLLGVMQEVLSLNGAIMILKQGRYRILPVAKAAQSALVPRVRRLKGLGHGLQIVPLEFIGAQEMSQILQPMLQSQGIIHTDKRRNLLILSGSEEQLNSLLDTIAIFDVDWLAGKSVSLFPLHKVEPEELVKDLEAALGGQGGELFDGVVRLIPIQRVNGLLVVSNTPAYMREIQQWIKRLDVANDKAEKRLYVYHLQNAKAVDIAAILSSIFTESSTLAQRPEASVMPSATPVVVESQSPENALPPVINQQAARPGSDSGVSLSGENSVRIIADEVNNSLVVMATAREYEMVESTIRKLDTLPKQVLIEATIIEVRLAGELSYGVEWFFKNKAGGGRGGEGQLSLGTDGITKLTPGFSYSIIKGASDIRLVLNALESATNFQVLSSPSLMVLDNKTASINVGDEIPIPTRQSSSNIDPNAPTVNEIQYRNTGVTLIVTPRINAGGLVTLEVTQEVSDAIVTNTSGIDAPTIQQRTIESTVAIQNGESVVLGGLIRDRVEDRRNGVPLLSRLPVVGGLFGETSDSDQRTELLIVLTPRVIGNSQQAREITEEYRNKLARPVEF